MTAEEELALLHREHGRAVHEIVMLFDQHDANGDGSLDADEVKIMIGALGQDLSEQEAAQLVTHLDRDGDGEVRARRAVLGPSFFCSLVVALALIATGHPTPPPLLNL